MSRAARSFGSLLVALLSLALIMVGQSSVAGADVARALSATTTASPAHGLPVPVRPPQQLVSARRPDAGSPVGTNAASRAALDRSSRLTGVAAEGAARLPGVIRAGELKLPGVPQGAIGTPVRTGKGLEYQIPRGTPELDPRVASIRVMDPVTTGKYQYPNGYVSYMNEGGQVVNPLTGGTLQPSDLLWHIELP